MRLPSVVRRFTPSWLFGYILDAKARLCDNQVQTNFSAVQQDAMRIIALHISFAWLVAVAIADDTEIEVSNGLTILSVADDDLVPDCCAIAVDPSGRVIASGPGYIRMLEDGNDDGQFDTYRTLVDGPERGAQGLCVDGDQLFYVGDSGVWQLSIADPNESSDRKPTRVLEVKTGGEHDAHALRKGPDGYWYLIAGNGAEVMFTLQNEDRSFVPNPRAGVIWRISPDWSRREVWAHGFRNAYDFDFAPDQSIVTFDSDGERDVSLPWYRPTRVFRVRRGDDAGWVTRSWKRNDNDAQMPQLLASLGRGSPTGVMRYRHRRLPPRFRNGVLVLDWTFGRVISVAENGETHWVARPGGTAGFAVTDIDALPDGRLILSVGGRRTRGGLYVIDSDKESSSGHAGIHEVDWSKFRSTAEVDATLVRIRELRDRVEPAIDVESAKHAGDLLQTHDGDEQSLMLAMSLLIESIGGLGAGDPKDARGKEQVAAVFDGYRSRLRPKLDTALLLQLTSDLTSIVASEAASEKLKSEAIRALAVLEPESHEVFRVIVGDLDRVESPIAKLHRLIALARLPVSRSDEMTEQVVQSMLSIPIEIDRAGLNVDRNWTPRLGELFLALERRDSLLPSRLVADAGFGHPSHLVWTDRMDPENLERIRHRCLSHGLDVASDPAIARFVAMGDDAVPRSFIRAWLADPLTRSAAWLAMASHPKASDASELKNAAFSVDKTVRESARRALVRLGVEIPKRESDSTSAQRWFESSESIFDMSGDRARGKVLFAVRQCAKCHDGGKALGPSLKGISKRFSTSDIFRATVDPNHTISDRYRSRQVLTHDGRLLTGIMIYGSVDGLTLLTADAKTLRINTDSIIEVKISDTSLMPESLLDGLSNAQVADLLAYLQGI